jgi:rod shape-determining protein MreC
MCASGVANAFNGFVDVFTQYDDLKAENAELREKLEQYENKEYNESLLKEQNDWLKNYINLHNAHPNFVFTDARVIAREANNYSTVLTFNKGSVSGIKRGMPVMTDQGLLGHVGEVGLDWCKVVTVIEATGSIGVYAERSGALGMVEGNAELRRNGLCKMTYISSTDLQIGDKIFTGNSSIYPPDLLIGTVSDITTDSATGEMVAVITPAIDFTDLNSLRGALILVSK